MTTTGTNYFKDLYAAFRYYAQCGYDDRAVMSKIKACEIHIGKPKISLGETLNLIDNGTRYAITSKENKA